MQKEEIQSIIKTLVEKTAGEVRAISIAEEKPGMVWVSVELTEHHPFTSRDGEGLYALNHLIHRIIETKTTSASDGSGNRGIGVVIDINGFQKKRVDNVRAIAHMMSERARYFKSNIEVDPMTPFERRIIHEFLADAQDLETESIGTGRSRRVVIKYKGEMK